jgi:F0F1-type ATP synthase membrane subunit b/b'
MEKTLQALGGILLLGLPTFILVGILAACAKFFYLNPLQRVLDDRFRLTEGAKQAAEASLKTADEKIGEYERALNEARAQIYREQAEFLRNLHSEQAEMARVARLETEERVASIRLAIAQEADVARENLESQADALAAEIADSILRRRVVA